MKDDEVMARLDSIRTEIETGTTFSKLAQTEYSLGNKAHGDELFIKADRAYQEAVKWIGRADERGVEVGDERHAGETLKLLLVDVRQHRP